MAKKPVKNKTLWQRLRGNRLAWNLFLIVVIMLALAYLGSTELLTPTHIFLYQVILLVPGLLFTEWTRTV